MPLPDRRSRRNPESGFALLFVYAMAATVAVMLYMELPRVAFEAQRDKEQLLIDRGEQYSRAVNLYVRKFNRYPGDFDALQSTQNLRFLRHKYLDPMTGKDDWRIIHVGPGGVFTDSLVYGKKKAAATEQQTFITELQQIGGNQTVAPAGGVNIGTRQRPNDQPGAPGDPNNPNAPPPPQIDANGQPVPNPNTAQQGGFPSPGPSGANGQNQLPPGYQAPTTSQPLQDTQPANIAQPTASNLINQILTTPRPGGFPGSGAQQQTPGDPNNNSASTTNAPNNTGTAPNPTQGQTIGGGIAGVASKREQDAIKSYKDRTVYNEWEFVYDLTKDSSR
ncbi:MAG: hypothetical protein M3N93_00295, partial [Acidobacteriota bacterium]|nr:hypothetical protein [Acidobacteriota bacterium]